MRADLTAAETESVVIALWLKHGQKMLESKHVLTEECFTDEKLRVMWAGISAVVAAREVPDPVTVGRWLHSAHYLDAVGGPLALRELVINFAFDVTSYDQHARALIEGAARRRLSAVLQRGLAALESDRDRDSTEHAESVVREVMAVQRGQDGAARRQRTFSDIADEVMLELTMAHDPERRHELERSCIPFGIEPLDEIVGGAEGGRTYCIGGRPGEGKSAVMLAIALSMAARGVWCGVASLEMTDSQLFKRALFAAVGKSWRTIARDPALARVALDGIAVCANLPIVVDDRPSSSIARISAWARSEYALGRMGVLFVDYLQLVDAGLNKRGANREQEVSAVSRGLKALALELKIPVFLAAQLNRDAAAPKTKPTKAHLRESGAIEQDADVIILLHTDAEPGDEVIDLDAIVDKNRDGKTGTAELTFDRGRMRFQGRPQGGPRVGR